MVSEYVYPKKKFEKSNIEFMYLFFDNGDYVSLDGKEVVEIKVNLYDRLIWGECDICPVAESGFIKLNIRKANKAIDKRAFLYSAEEFEKDRKGYIEHRCVREGGMRSIRIFDENHWHDTIYGNIVGETDGEFLVLKFLRQPGFGSANSDKNMILLNDISKTFIQSIDLDFENCEGFTIYKNEIREMQLEFEKELIWDAGDLFRSVKCGFIKLKLDRKINYRKAYFSGDEKITSEKLKKRLLWGKSQSNHDICHLYVDYDYAGFGSRRTECLKIEDIRSDEELARIEKMEEEGNYNFDYFVGGYCKKQNDGTILMTFGKNDEDLLKK